MAFNRLVTGMILQVALGFGHEIRHVTRLGFTKMKCDVDPTSCSGQKASSIDNYLLSVILFLHEFPCMVYLSIFG